MPLSNAERRALVARKVRAVRLRRAAAAVAVAVPLAVGVAVMRADGSGPAVVVADGPSTTTTEATTTTTAATTTTTAGTAAGAAVTTTTTGPAGNRSATTTTTTTAEAERYCGTYQPQATTPPQGIAVTVELSSSAVASGSSVDITVRVRNTTLQPYHYTWTGHRAAAWVVDRTGRTVWVSDWGLVYGAESTADDLKPGEEKGVTYTWASDQVCNPDGGSYLTRPLPAGRYTVHGSWTAAPPWAAQPVALDLR